MDASNIKLDCYGLAESRIPRLTMVAGYLQALADLHQTNVIDKIIRLYDYKGTLTVTWTIRPTEFEKSMIVTAWESPVGDRGGPVEHKLNDRKILDTTE